MFSIIRKLNFLVGLTLCVIVNGFTQTVTSTKNGIWTDPSLWDGGQVPTLANATEIVINHDVAVPDGSIISIHNVVLNGMLTLGPGTVVDLIPDGLIEKWDFQIFGRLTMQDGAVLNGTSIANTSFESGARYIHLQGPLGFIPYATWNSNSTFEIAGFRTQGYINIAHSDSWKQNFGHVTYNCTQQTTAFVDLNGYLRNIAWKFYHPKHQQSGASVVNDSKSRDLHRGRLYYRGSFEGLVQHESHQCYRQCTKRFQIPVNFHWYQLPDDQGCYNRERKGRNGNEFTWETSHGLYKS